MDRVIFHCDLNSFYASVELLSHPELRHLPVAVCGDPQSRHGIILAKNEPAKAFGVKTAETIWQARRKCPELVLLPPHHEKYRAMSARINRIYGEYTDLGEPFSVECGIHFDGLSKNGIGLVVQICGEMLEEACRFYKSCESDGTSVV